MSNYTMFTASANSRLADTTVLVTQDLAKTLDLQDSEQIFICVGQTRCRFNIAIRDSDKLKMKLAVNPGMLKRLFLQPEKDYGIKKDINGLHLGPVIGISADITNEKGSPFGNQRDRKSVV